MNSNTSHIYPAPNGENDHGEGYTGTSDGEGTHALLARYHDSTIDPYTLALGGFLMAIVLCGIIKVNIEELLLKRQHRKTNDELNNIMRRQREKGLGVWGKINGKDTEGA